MRRFMAVALLVAPLAAQTPPPSRFVPLPPCRLVDTRLPDSTRGGPYIVGKTSRSFPLVYSCGIPPFTVAAYSLNITAIPKTLLGYLTVWPAGSPQPFVSTLNSPTGRIVANAAIVKASPDGAISVYASDATDVVIDVNGYFAASTSIAFATTSSGFYPVAPCRAVDTRGQTGSLGGPTIGGAQSRQFPLSGVCGLPASAVAYSLNITAVPDGPLGFLTVWPAGQAQPGVSTLNSVTGAIVANAAIVPAGVNGDIQVFATDPSHVVIDVNGYFGAAQGSGLSFYPIDPCRAVDTRGATGPFGDPPLGPGKIRTFPFATNPCGRFPNAGAYSLNVTVVPPGQLLFLTLFPAGPPAPYVSTLNSLDGLIVANQAIVPASATGSVSVLVTNVTDLVLDINGYFAP